MKNYFVFATNLPETVNRTLLMQIFQPFGHIKKLYLHPDLTFAKIYVASLEIAGKALILNEQPPYFMKLAVETEEFSNKKNTNTSSVSESSSTMSYDEECYGIAGPTYYNIHGVAVPTLSADDGTLYVALNDVKEIGFALFDSDSIPRNINFNKQMMDEFRLYLNMKARNYLNKMHCNIPSNAVEEVKKEILNSYVSNGAIPRDPTRRHNISPQTNSNPPLFAEPKVNTRGKAQTPSMFQNEQQKPLRKPASNVKNEKGQNASSNSYTSRPPKGDGVNRRLNHNYGAVTEKEDATPKLQDKRNMAQAEVKRVELPLNKPVQVTISFVESSEKCWVFRTADKEKLEKLLFETNFEATKGATIKPIVGQMCASTYRGAWYRALIQEVTPTVKVQFLDFGNFGDEVKDLRELSAKVASEPVLAVKLNFITPPKTTLQDDVTLNVTVLQKNDDGSYQVEEVIRKGARSNVLNAVPSGKTIIAQPESKNDGNDTCKTSPKPRSANGFLPKSTASAAAARIETKMQSNSAQTSIVASVNPTSDLTDGVSKLTLKEKLQKVPPPKKEIENLNPDRKSVVDLLETTTGVVQFVSRLNDDSCIAFVFPEQFLEEMTVLEKISEEEETSSVTAKIGDSVLVYKQDILTWVRGTIFDVKTNKYSAALVDYGEVTTTDKIRKLDERYRDIPEFSCVCFGNKEYINFMEKNSEMDFTSSEKNNIEVGSYKVNCKRWDPFVTSKLADDSEEFELFTTPPRVKTIKDGERVLIVALNDKELLVRNRETYELLNKVNEEISTYKASPLPRNPVIDQLVLASHETRPKLCRGIIKSVNTNYADVEFIDYGFTDTVPLKNLKNINRSLATKCCALIPISLNQYEDGQFSDGAIEYIETCAKEGKKLLTKKYADNVYDLFTLNGNDTMSLSSKLKSISNMPQCHNSNASINQNGVISVPEDVKLMYKDIKKKEITPGDMENFLCLGIEGDSGSITLFTNDGSQYIQLSDQIVKYIETDENPYDPDVDELCLAKYEGEWFRAKVEDINRAIEEYEVYYIDYGNTAKILSKDIRKMPADLVTVPALAIIGRLKEMENNPGNAKILNIIKEEIVVGNPYKVNIIKKLGDITYEISIPELAPLLEGCLNF